MGGADIGECLSTIYRIKEGDDESWFQEWSKTARRLEETAILFRKQGKSASARECWLRASNYWRTAEFFLHANPDDPRIVPTWAKSRDCFVEAAALSPSPIIRVDIPFEKTSLPGYLCLVDSSGKKRPLLIVHTGFDGTAEELCLSVVQPARERGINCLVFEGPGQGQVIRIQKIPFRHNWETVVTPVVDFALTRGEVDPAKIALMGVSMGGYLAPRAAAYEKRLSALIANGGVYDFYAVTTRHGPPNMEEILEDPEASAEYDVAVREMMKTDPNLRWVFGHGMWAFGASSPSAWQKMLRPYKLIDEAKKISCPTLVVDSENDIDMPGQSKLLFEALTCPKDFLLFTAEEGAGEHCQVGASLISNERILGWLEDTFNRAKAPTAATAALATKGK
jgi:alpha-beta hydrolase superfamily lysophospholipase